MTAAHIELLVEEPSMEAFLVSLLPRILSDEISFQVHPFQGKSDLMKELEGRLRGYSSWLPDNWRVVVVVDRDNEDCFTLKAKMEGIADRSGLLTRAKSSGHPWQLVNRIAIEELEAWYFGDWPAVVAAYPRVNQNVPNQASFRDPDAIGGGTWEAFERTLQRHGYFKTGLRKIEAAREIAIHFEPGLNRSASFRKLHGALLEATA